MAKKTSAHYETYIATSARAVRVVGAGARAAVTSAYKIEVRFLGGLTTAQKNAFKAAADRWASVIVGDLPSVRVGWGDDIQRRLRLLSEQVADTSAIDPRIAALAREVAGDAGQDPMLRARKAYRWVQDNIKDGQEADARRVLTARAGNRWSALRMLLRALDVPVSYLVVKNRLAPPSPGPTANAMPRGLDAAAWMAAQSISFSCSAIRFQSADFGFLIFGRRAFGTSDQSRLSSTSGS